MSGWTAPASQGPGLVLPEGYRIAGMGRRIGAWLLDRVLEALLGIVPVVLAIASGAITLNQTAIDQLMAVPPSVRDPYASVTAPIVNVRTSDLVIPAIVWLVLSALYYVGSWVTWGASPGQRALGLRVVDVDTRRKLPLIAAANRWLLLSGIADCIAIVTLVSFMDWMGRTPANQWMGLSHGGTATGYVEGLSPLTSFVGSLSTLWSVILLITSAMNRARRGWHDRIVGSVVVGRIPVVVPYPYGYPPQGWVGPQGQWYPPQEPGSPQGGWPQQGGWQPPQGGWQPPQGGWQPPQQGQWPGQQRPGQWPGQPGGWPQQPQQGPWPGQPGQWPGQGQTPQPPQGWTQPPGWPPPSAGEPPVAGEQPSSGQPAGEQPAGETPPPDQPSDQTEQPRE